MAAVFQYDFENVEDYLHHRVPYLMVGAIERIESRSIQTSTLISGEEYFLKGHFPGASVVPGAMLQEMATQSAGILLAARFNPMEEFNTHDPLANDYALGVLIRVKHARFRSFSRPGDHLRAQIELTDQLNNIFEFNSRITLNAAELMSATFQLANIPSAKLRGGGSNASIRMASSN